MTVDGIASTLEETMLTIWADFISHLPYIIAALIMIGLTFIVSSLAGRVANRVVNRTQLRGSLRNLLMRVINIIVWAFGLLLAAMLIFPGLTPTKALGGLGIASVAIGFAFKDIFENFFAGILLLWKFPFENGDYIECEGLVGRVENIYVRMTQLRKVNGELIVVPNSFLFKNPVFVLTDRDIRRTTLIIGIAYGENVDKAIPVIKAAAESCETVDKNMSLQVFMREFAASSVDIEITWWTDSTPVGLRRSKNEMVSAVKRALDENDIEIPFPYRTLTFKEPLTINNTVNEQPAN